MEAQSESPAAEQALDKLCRIYWRPVYSFVRRQGAEVEEAKDLTQSFFALILERHDLDAVRKEKGRLRSYLLTSLANTASYRPTQVDLFHGSQDPDKSRGPRGARQAKSRSKHMKSIVTQIGFRVAPLGIVPITTSCARTTAHEDHSERPQLT